MKKPSILKIIAFAFPVILWGYFLLAPEIQSNKILIHKNILGIKFQNESIFVVSPVLAEKLTSFFEPKPISIANSKTIQNIVPEKFSIIPFHNYSVGFLQSPLTDEDLKIINQSPISLHFDVLITTTSQIPNNINTNIATVYLNTRKPSQSLNEKFRLSNQPLIWAETEILLDFSGKEIQILK